MRAVPGEPSQVMVHPAAQAAAACNTDAAGAVHSLYKAGLLNRQPRALCNWLPPSPYPAACAAAHLSPVPAESLTVLQDMAADLAAQTAGKQQSLSAMPWREVRALRQPRANRAIIVRQWSARRLLVAALVREDLETACSDAAARQWQWERQHAPRCSSGGAMQDWAAAAAAARQERVAGSGAVRS